MRDASTACHICKDRPARIDIHENLHCCSQCEQERRTRNKKNFFDNMKDRLCDKAQIPAEFKDAVLDRRYADHVNDSFFITGPRGVGKTHFACALLIANMRKNGKYAVKFINMPDLLSELRSCYNNKGDESAILDKYTKHCSALVVDDLGTEKVTEWVQSVIYLIVDRRYRERKQTIFTSNADLEAISDTLGDHIASRISGMCTVIKMSGNDRRVA